MVTIITTDRTDLYSRLYEAYRGTHQLRMT